MCLFWGVCTPDRVDDATRFLIVATTFFAMMRALVFLSNASLFFFVMDQSLKASLVEFTGVHLVVALCLFGAASSNYIIAGQSTPLSSLIYFRTLRLLRLCLSIHIERALSSVGWRSLPAACVAWEVRCLFASSPSDNLVRGVDDFSLVLVWSLTGGLPQTQS